MSDNSKIAYVFPGQGAQAVGMGADIFERFESARMVFATVDHVLGFPLSDLCFNGPDEELTLTVNVQPALLTVSMAYLRAAEEMLGSNFPKPDYLAGHSLGHYTALVVAGILSLADGARLVRERGRLMYEAGQATAGGMLAVIGADEKVLDELCIATGIEVSNRNCPGQVVVSGALDKLDEFKKQAAEKGIRRVIPLKVSGAFHSKLMQTAVEELREAVSECNFHEPLVPVVSNVTSEVTTGIEQIQKDLVDQVISCVLWQKSVESMITMGVGTFYEIGHGQVLGGLIKRINPDVNVYHIGELLKIK